MSFDCRADNILSPRIAITFSLVHRANAFRINPLNILIYGASSSVGLYAAQLVRHSASFRGKSVRLFGTASKARFPLLQGASYNYDHLVDYRDSSWPEQIKELTGGEGIHYAYDCISEHNSVAKVHSTLNASDGKQAIVRSRPAGAWTAGHLDPEPIYGAVWEGLGVKVQYAFFTVPAPPRAREFAVAFYKWQSETGGLRPNHIRYVWWPGENCSMWVCPFGPRDYGQEGRMKNGKMDEACQR